jgi:hypothetical protein
VVLGKVLQDPLGLIKGQILAIFWFHRLFFHLHNCYSHVYVSISQVIIFRDSINPFPQPILIGDIGVAL